jgi:hypothetical protein
MAEGRKATASPTKTFFVRMITRDISLEDCILDLIDNSIDSAWQREGGQPMSLADGADLSRYKIEIRATTESFLIRDNCGGLTLDDAANYAFTFGRKRQEREEPYSIGVYGIGMKRAVFKIGTDIKIRSTYLNGDKTESFTVPIKVPRWLENEVGEWDFDIEESAALESPGVEIEVKDLTEASATAFGNPAFVQNLKRMISRDYSLHMHRGLSIEFDKEPIKGWQIEMLQGGDFAPMRITYEDKIGDHVVNVEILAGMAAPPPENSDPEENEKGDNKDGWYVVCNGRIVLAADKTTLSGWGTDDWPQWHRQYSGFIGLAMFTSAKTEILPLTTTKRSVDVSSEIYRRARSKMREASRAWIDYTNVRKQAIEEAKSIEAQAKPLSIFQLKASPSVALPKLTPKPKIKQANISYSMPIERVRKLAQALGNINMSYRDVGITTFEYTYGDNVEEE